MARLLKSGRWTWLIFCAVIAYVDPTIATGNNASPQPSDNQSAQNTCGIDPRREGGDEEDNSNTTQTSSDQQTEENDRFGIINPVEDVSWRCMFPITLAGVTIGAENDDTLNEHQSAICTCNSSAGGLPTVGLKYALWEPARIIDTVSDPYCLMPLGTKVGASSNSKLRGSQQRTAQSTRAFQQMHYYIFPVFQILDMFYDIPCLGGKEFDVAMMTEIVPTWNNDLLALLLNPEAILFGNPLTQLACAADSISALTGLPRKELFWCLGSWGNAYPLAGSITASDYLEANAGIAARGIYFMARSGLLWESTADGCSKRIAPIWRKDKYKLQMMRPTRDSNCIPIGRDALLWGAGKHHPYRDNFMWMMFKKLDCCVTLY
jgi:conjugal transfer pilus assembly protein TraU